MPQVVEPPRPTGHGGYGLRLLERFSTDWGIERPHDGCGKCVRFEAGISADEEISLVTFTESLMDRNVIAIGLATSTPPTPAGFLICQWHARDVPRPSRAPPCPRVRVPTCRAGVFCERRALVIAKADGLSIGRCGWRSVVAR